MIVTGDPLNVTLTFCDAGTDPFTALKKRAEGLASNPVLLFPTARFTAKLNCPEVVITVTVPVSVLPAVSRDGLTVTITEPAGAEDT